MTKQTELRAYPDLEPMAEVDRLLFGPVDPIVQTNKRLTVALTMVATLVCVTVLGLVGVLAYFETRPVRVLSFNAAGEVDSFLLRTTGFTLHKAETQAALRKSLTEWAEFFYSRLRTPLNGEIATTAYAKSFLFLSNDLAQVYAQREARVHEIAAFLSSGEAEYKAMVTNVVFRNLDRKPYEADLYFDRVYYAQPLTATARKSYFVTIQFLANPADDEVERLRKRANLDLDSIMRMNPLVITLIRVGDEQPFTTSPLVQQ